MTTPEGRVEKYLVAQCQKHKLMCLKFTSPGTNDVPDRIVIGTDADHEPLTLFVEVKAPGSVPRPSQVQMFTKMRDYGAHVVVVDSTRAVDALINDYVLSPPTPIYSRDPHAAPLPGKRPKTHAFTLTPPQQK